MANIKAPKKLIEVALPLDDINAAASREKSIRHGHPSTLHLWWARRPLAAARAVLFSQMVNDPGGERGYYAGKTKAQADAEREKLFDIIRDLVKWENTNNEVVLERAREAIRQSWRETCELNKGKPGFNPEKLPAFHDPFAGGGSIPLEAQRLGLESYASDLNPVAVMINKAMIEIPPRFAGRIPRGPIPANDKQRKLSEDWSGAKGLAEDVRRYGYWMREEAFRRIGYLYPKVKITKELAKGREDLHSLIGKELKVISWIWTRTVKHPSPAYRHLEVPLTKSFALSTKNGKAAWVEVNNNEVGYSFNVCIGEQVPEKWKKGSVDRKGGICPITEIPVPLKYIREQGKKGNLGEKLLAIVAEGHKGRIFLSPTIEQEYTAKNCKNVEMTSLPIDHWAGCTNSVVYGLDSFEKLYTPRQAATLSTFVDLLKDVEKRIRDDLVVSINNKKNTDEYIKAILVYLLFAIDKMADRGSTICSWDSSRNSLRNTFGRHAIPMTWDFAESNPFSGSTGNFLSGLGWGVKFLLTQNGGVPGKAYQGDAASSTIYMQNSVISSDPPYYDNVPYSNVSEFFYYWMRQGLRGFYPELFGTIEVPKYGELVANKFRHSGKESAEEFFMNGMTNAMHNMAEKGHPSFPVTIYYAFKQSETKDASTSSIGWETFLEAVIRAGFTIDGTWPMSTEMGSRLRGARSNALASSIVLVCRKRDPAADSISRRQFQRQLREELPGALETMIGGESGQSPIAPVDLAQAAIGPGMGIYSQYAAVLNQDGSAMSVHDALVLINRVKDEVLGGIGAADADTGFCVDWFAQYGWKAGPFGKADILAKAKGTSVDGVKEAGVIESSGGKVCLLTTAEYPADWDPATDSRIPVWEACHHLIRALNQGGESSAGTLLARMPERGEPIRALAYYLYNLCENKKWAEDARAYNELVTTWHAIVTASQEAGTKGAQAYLNL